MAADRERLIGFAGAVLVHLALVGLLAFSMEKKPEAPANPAVTPIVQARAISEVEVMEPMRRRQAEEAEKQRQAQEAQRKAAEEQRRAAEAERKAAEAAKRKAVEKARLVELEKKQAAEKARLAEQERQRKTEAEKQRKAEAERKAAEERKKAEAERRRLEEEARKRQEAEQSLKLAMAAENERLAQEQQRRRQLQLLSVRQQYVADIRNKVERSWRRETGSSGSHCRVLIHQIPSGEVINVRLNECDGDVAFQRSVEAAVRKASPLPLPSDPEVFEREIEFVFEPQSN
jgi:colicin import membrane protein